MDLCMSSYEDLTSKDVERGLNTPKTTSQLTQITSLFTKPIAAMVSMTVVLKCKEFADTKGVIRICKSKKGR